MQPFELLSSWSSNFHFVAYKSNMITGKKIELPETGVKLSSVTSEPLVNALPMQQVIYQGKT